MCTLTNCKSASFVERLIQQTEDLESPGTHSYRNMHECNVVDENKMLYTRRWKTFVDVLCYGQLSLSQEAQ